MINNFVKKNILVIILLLISLVSHWYIFFDFKILNSGDWVHYSNSSLSNIFSANIYSSSSNLGVVSVFPNNWIFYIFAYILNSFRLSWDVFTRLFFIIPIVFLTPIFSFLLFRKILQNKLVAFFSASIYSFNTFFLKLQLDWITYAFIWWVLPASLLCIIQYLESKRWKYLIYNSLLIFLGIAYEIRIMILVFVFLSIFQLIYLLLSIEKIKNKLKNIFLIYLSFFIGILCHFYWLIPMKFGELTNDIMIRASPNPFVAFYDILDVFTLHMYSWSYNFVLEPFIKQPIEFRHFLIPLISIFGLLNFKYILKIKKQNIYFLFFSVTLIVFIFLGKQTLAPFKEFYSWAYFNIPLFNLYRESSKFFILIALSLSFFFGIGLFYFYKFITNKFNKKVALFSVVIILFFSSFFNLQHFIDQDIGAMVRGIEIPKDYQQLETKLAQESTYYRLLWLPVKHRFGYFSENHPVLNMTSLVSIYKDKVGSDLFDGSTPAQNKLVFLLNQIYSNRLLDNLSVKYIVIPSSGTREKKTNINNSELVFEIFEHYGLRQYFINETSKVNYLKKIDIGTKELVVYENEGFRPHIYTTDEKETISSEIPYKKIDFQFRNPTEYRVSLKNISSPAYVNFSESFHKNWKVHVGGFNWFTVLTDKNYFLPDSIHFENDAKLNSFLIDSDYIKKNINKKNYKINPDGSIDLELTLFFKPQSYFYFGLIISGATLLSCIGYLIYDWRKNRSSTAKTTLLKPLERTHGEGEEG